MSKVQYFEENTSGRDFVVGDIHGSFDMVLEAMKIASFDRERDRLFCVGDMVDRGQGSPRAERFLEQPYVHSVLGNHEAMFLDIYSDPEIDPADEHVLRALTARNGMRWWMNIAPAARSALIERFRRLPVAIEIATRRGTIGLLHAEVPPGMDWAEFKSRIEQGDPEAIHSALWGRERALGRHTSGVAGVGRVFVGHTAQWNGLTKLGNIYYLDTGAVFHALQEEDGRLTMVQAATHTEDLIQGRPHQPVDVRTGRIPDTPFGTSLVEVGNP